MFRFLFGVGVGVGLAWFTRSRYAKDLKVEERMTEIQKKADAVLLESRHLLQETRGELQAAADAGITSIQRKAERMRIAVEHPEVVEREHGREVPGPGVRKE